MCNEKRHGYYKDNKIKEGEMHGECGTHKIEDKCIHTWTDHLIPGLIFL